jgi:multicomponent Na+:H+ antiporter subunit C
MTSLMALVVGVLYAAAIYMMLRRSIVKLVIGLVLLSNAANLLIFTAAGLVADPLAQALILTAIVIGFGVLAFAVVLIRRAYEVVEADDMNQMRDTDT